MIHLPVEKQKGRNYDNVVSLAGPLALWIGIVIVAAALQLFVFPSMLSSGYGSFVNTGTELTNYILYIPGLFVIPMLASLWIGSKVGSTEGDNEEIMIRSLVNAFYSAVVYLIVIFTIYLLSQSTKNGAFANLSVAIFFEYAVVVPTLICVVIVPLFALITSARRY